MGNCFGSLKRHKNSSELPCILYPITLERRGDHAPEIRNRSDSLKYNGKDEGQTLARIYSYYIDQELQSLNEGNSSHSSRDDLRQNQAWTKRARTISQSTLHCGFCQEEITDNIFKGTDSSFCSKHSNCSNCGKKIVKGEDKFVVVSGSIYCKSHIRQYKTL